MNKNLILKQIRKMKQKKEEQSNIKKINSKNNKKNQSETSSTIASMPSSKSGNFIFSKMTFCFPVIDIDLTPKRIELLSQSILKQGGSIIEYKGETKQIEVNYLLINPKIQYKKLIQKIQTRIIFKAILSYAIIIQSIKQGVLLSLQNFMIYSKVQNPTQQTMTMRSSPFINKKIKLNNIEQNRQLKYKQKQQCLTDDENTVTLQPTTSQIIEQLKTKNKQTNLLKSKMQKYVPNKQLFLCQKKQQQQTFSINQFICDQLMQLQKIYQNQKDIGRKIAYLKAVSAIKSLNFQIQSQKDLQSLKGVGKKIMDKVKQLLSTGKLAKLQKLKSSQKRVVMNQLSKIWGVGPAKAQQLYMKGIKSIQQLKNKTDLLNKNQRIGLKYVEDFQKKIPRQKITDLFEVIKFHFSNLVDSIDSYHMQVCGSYRRGKMLCGDIDIIICRKDGKYEKSLLLNLIIKLQQNKILTDHLIFPSIGDPQSRSSMSYMGVCQFQDQTKMRIDIKYYHIEQYPYSLLYFTGSGMFNRSMRLFATKVGIQLSDHGMQNRPGSYRQIPICNNERQIFQFLGLDYKTPQQRDV